MVRNIKKTTYIAAFVISCLLFSAGILIGTQISNHNVSEMQKDIELMQTEYSTLETLMLLGSMANLSCDIYDKQIINFGAQTDNFGAKLEFVEPRVGKDDPDIQRMKATYWLMELRDFLVLKQVEQKCGKHHDTILYFYRDGCDMCEYQGKTLKLIKTEYPEVMIYSFDMNSSNLIIQSLKEIYSINEAPSVAINDITYVGFIKKEDLKKILKKEE